MEEVRRTTDEARARSDEYLYSIFPETIAEELKSEGKVEPRFYEMATILFADFKDFTRLTDGMEPARLIEQLNNSFGRFDQIASEN